MRRIFTISEAINYAAKFWGRKTPVLPVGWEAEELKVSLHQEWRDGVSVIVVRLASGSDIGKEYGIIVA